MTTYSRKNPFPAPVLENRLLSVNGSGKEIRHYEVSIKDSGFVYESGDSLGIFPTNNPQLVQEMIEILGATGEEKVTNWQGQEVTLRHALIRDYQITQPSKEFLQALIPKIEGESVIKELHSDPLRKQDLQKFLHGLETIDLLLNHPSAKFEVAEFVKSLRKLQPRLYSIASSPKMFPDTIHLTVSTLRYETHGRKRLGVCSACLAGHSLNAPVPVFIHVAKHFRPPEDHCAPLIMVGPGTGIAPFRAFLQDRHFLMTQGHAPGKNWLFFGDQKAKFDYLYQSELENFRDQKLLTNLHTAFSRDQEQKVYVQHRMLENAKELYAWLEEGAYFYVCGDAERMANDVDAALHKVIEQAGGKSSTEAAEYVENLKKAKRYRRDVY